MNRFKLFNLAVLLVPTRPVHVTAAEGPLAQVGQDVMTSLVVVGVVVFLVALLVVGSLISARRRRTNVSAADMREVLRATVPPEAGNVTDEALNQIGRQFTGASGGTPPMILGMLGAVALFIVAYQFVAPGLLRFLGLVVAGGLIALTFVLMMRQVVRSSNQSLAPLGLKMMAMPRAGLTPNADGGVRTNVSGATVLGGTRYGRDVRVSFAARGMSGQTVTVTVTHPVGESFEVSGRDKNWQMSPMPGKAGEVLRALPSLDREVTIVGDSNGITIERRRSSTEAVSARGTVQWLRDIQLAEKLADALR